MVNAQSKPQTVRNIYDSIASQPRTASEYTVKSNVLFGNEDEYTGNDKWVFIIHYLRAMIEFGIIKYDFEVALKEMMEMDSLFTLQCNTSMIELLDGTIIYSIRIFTAQRHKKEDQMFASLKHSKYLLLRGSFAIFKIKNGDIECIKVHPGIMKFENNNHTTDGKIITYTASEKLDGINTNIGGGLLDNGDIVIDTGGKNTPFIVYIPKKNCMSEMITAAQMICNTTANAPHMAFKILTSMIAKVPELLVLITTKYTCVFELLNRRMFEIYMGSEFEKLKNPELVLLRTYESGINVPISSELQSIFRTPKMFIVESDEYNEYIKKSFKEGVVGLNHENVPVVKNKTPLFALLITMSKLFRKGPVEVVAQDKFYNFIIELVMQKCESAGADPIQAKQFYLDYADMLSPIVYTIACEFRDGNFTITDITDEDDEVCNWGNIVSSVIKYYTDTLDPSSTFMKCYELISQ